MEGKIISMDMIKAMGLFRDTNIERLIILDPEAENSSVEFEIKLAYKVRFMGRNDPCFCGSGKKMKHCHPDVNEKSLVARMLALYAEIDERNKQAVTLCKKGCADCCKADFTIWFSEFMAILHSLNIIREGTGKNPFTKILNRCYTNNTGSCVLLDENDNSCTIYEVRPVVCRNYGITRQATEHPCERMRNYPSDKLVDEDKQPIDVYTDRILIRADNSTLTRHKDQYITFWFKNNINEDGSIKTQKMKDLLEASVSRPIDEFVKVLAKR